MTQRQEQYQITGGREDRDNKINKKQLQNIY